MLKARPHKSLQKLALSIGDIRPMRSLRPRVTNVGLTFLENVISGNLVEPKFKLPRNKRGLPSREASGPASNE